MVSIARYGIMVRGPFVHLIVFENKNTSIHSTFAVLIQVRFLKVQNRLICDQTIFDRVVNNRSKFVFCV